MMYTSVNDYEAAVGMLSAFFGAFVCISIYILILYIVNAIGLYQMAKKLNMSHPWMAFIPIANTYLLGMIAETYIHDNKLIGEFTKWLLILLPLLSFIPEIGGILSMIGSVYMLICQIFIVKEFDSKWYNYLMLFLLPGVSYLMIAKNRK